MKDTSDNGQKVTNLDYLNELSKGNSQFVQEMIRIFLEENPSEIALLEKGIKEKDFEIIKASAHKLRSTIPFVGIDRLIEDEISEMESLAGKQSGTQKIEIVPENPDIKKIEIIATDTSVIGQIEQMFKRIKEVCEKACSELSVYNPGVG